MTIIEQIKAEIERLMDEYKPIVGGVDELTGAHIVLAKLHSFLSTLESEKPMQEELKEEINRTYHDGSVTDTSDLDHVSYENIARHFYDLGCRRTAEKYDEIEYNRQQAEEQVCDNFQSEYERYIASRKDGLSCHNVSINIKDMAEHFAQWGAEHLATSNKTLAIKPGDEVTINGHKIVYDKDKGYVTIVKSEESVPNDLEEAAWEYAPDLPSYNIGGGYLPPQSRDDLRTAFKDGAKWQVKQLLKSSPLPEDTVLFNKGVEEGKRLMMEETVEGTVMDFSSNQPRPQVNVYVDSNKYHTGDKVRVIVCKKEDEK